MKGGLKKPGFRIADARLLFFGFKAMAVSYISEFLKHFKFRKEEGL